MTIHVHSSADVQSTHIGDGTRIWQGCVVLRGARIGTNCNVCAHVFIENDVVVGDNVTIKGGVQLWDGIRLGNDVFVGPSVAFTNDLFPRSKQHQARVVETVVGAGASIGANATILAGVVLGERAMIGAGAVVTRSVPPNAIVVGNPARIIGYAEAKVGGSASTARAVNASGRPFSVSETGVKGVATYQFPVISDIRGDLTVGEFESQIPFTPKRYFMVFGVPSKETRGEHAHHVCHQFLICIRGSCAVMADDGRNRVEVTLDSPEKGLYLPPMTWGVQYKYSSDAVLLVFASHYYEASDYIRSYAEFIELTKKHLS